MVILKFCFQVFKHDIHCGPNVSDKKGWRGTSWRLFPVHILACTDSRPTALTLGRISIVMCQESLKVFLLIFVALQVNFANIVTSDCMWCYYNINLCVCWLMPSHLFCKDCLVFVYYFYIMLIYVLLSVKSIKALIPLGLQFLLS